MHLHVPSLVDIQQSAFHKGYQDGLAYALLEKQEEPGPLHDLYLADIFTLARLFGYFDKQQEQHLYAHVGFALGEIHGSVLLPDGMLRREVTALVALQDPDIARGYHAGREFFFVEADSDEERTLTDGQLLERLRELDAEYETYQDNQQTLRFSVGGLLGLLSGPLFFWTPQEEQKREQESLKILGYVEPLYQECLAARLTLFQPA